MAAHITRAARRTSRGQQKSKRGSWPTWYTSSQLRRRRFRYSSRCLRSSSRGRGAQQQQQQGQGRSAAAGAAAQALSRSSSTGAQQQQGQQQRGSAAHRAAHAQICRRQTAPTASHTLLLLASRHRGCGGWAHRIWAASPSARPASRSFRTARSASWSRARSWLVRTRTCGQARACYQHGASMSSSGMSSWRAVAAQLAWGTHDSIATNTGGTQTSGGRSAQHQGHD